MVTLGIVVLDLTSYLSGLMYLNTFDALDGLPKPSLGLLEMEDELVERDDGLLHAVNGALYSTEEVETSDTPEDARGRRGFLR